MDWRSVDPRGLSLREAEARLQKYGRNELRDRAILLPVTVLVEQFRSPFVLILLTAAVLSFAVGEMQEGVIIAVIVMASSALGFLQEYRAANIVASLQARLDNSVQVLRDGTVTSISAAHVVPGDVVPLRAGSMIPADGLVLAANSLHVDEAPLTGESYPAEKHEAAGDAPEPDALLRMGTSVRSGTGTMVVTATGASTEYAHIAMHARGVESETSFARGIRRFGMLMTQTMAAIVLIILPINILLGRPIVDSVLFAAALAVGLTPELLPAVVTVTLSRGARELAKAKVLVRRLVAIENLGSIDILCTDKTGTLTEGRLTVAGLIDDAKGSAVGRWARINAQYQEGLENPLDRAIIEGTPVLTEPVVKIAELPYDFERKCLSVCVETGARRYLVTKGAPKEILKRCTRSGIGGSRATLRADQLAAELARIETWSRKGLRAIAVAVREVQDGTVPGRDEETEMDLVGYVLFEDPVKPGLAQVVADLRRHGVSLKIISGDNRHVAAYVAEAVGLPGTTVLTGDDLSRLSRRSLARRLAQVDVFAEVTPDQKEHIIEAYRHIGKVVGYLGDGINDAPALRAADLGISVDNAVPAAREAADVVLLERNLHVLLDGIITGRTSFANTLKYVSITTSANLGNMISMALASMFLPFLPLLAKQILINNFLSDLPMLAVSTDRVDAAILQRPGIWDFRRLMRSMFAFGAVSSLFDLVTFGLLLFLFHENPAGFQTGWFIESLLTEIGIIFVMRTQLPALSSRPGALLVLISVTVAIAGIGITMLPLGATTGLVPLPAEVIAGLIVIVALYCAASELLKRRLRLDAGSARPSRPR
jgi:Mg2+-importing ATPase